MRAIFVRLKPSFTSIEVKDGFNQTNIALSLALVLSKGWRVYRCETSCSRSERKF